MKRISKKYILGVCLICFMLMVSSFFIINFKTEALSEAKSQQIKKEIYKKWFLPNLGRGVSFKYIKFGKEVPVFIAKPKNKECDYYVYIDYCYKDWNKNCVKKEGKKKRMVYGINKEKNEFKYKDLFKFYGNKELFKKNYSPTVYSGKWFFSEEHNFDPIKGNKQIMLKGIIKTIGYDLRYHYKRKKSEYTFPSKVEIIIGQFNSNFNSTVVKVVDDRWPLDEIKNYSVSLDYITVDELKKILEKNNGKYKMYYAYRYIGRNLRVEVEEYLKKYNIKTKIKLYNKK